IATALVGRPESWPEDVPPRAFYDRIWESDARLQSLQPREHYLAGVLRFYSGTVWVPGWKRRQSEIQNVPGPDRIADLALLGRWISSEWSKPESISRISSKTLALWGTALRDARDAEQFDPVLERIRDDVRSLLDGSLPPSAVTPERYGAPALPKEVRR
ncbi:MAG TPA: hypothetical protein VKW04_19320, partial [Planctomycetota bacterium]|nr:hypothetical protein [Planctomycetota bacterium]